MAEDHERLKEFFQNEWEMIVMLKKIKIFN